MSSNFGSPYENESSYERELRQRNERSLRDAMDDQREQALEEAYRKQNPYRGQSVTIGRDMRYGWFAKLLQTLGKWSVIPTFIFMYIYQPLEPIFTIYPYPTPLMAALLIILIGYKPILSRYLLWGIALIHVIGYFEVIKVAETDESKVVVFFTWIGATILLGWLAGKVNAKHKKKMRAST